MSNLVTLRKSNAPLVKEIRHSIDVSDGQELVTPDGCWDIVINKARGGVSVMLVSRPLVLPAFVSHTAGQEMLVITFALGAFIDVALPATPTGMHLLPMTSKNRFWLGSRTVEIPTFKNADCFAEDLHRQGFLTIDPVVADALADDVEYHPRTRQRHFRRITGMTLAYYKQVERAHAAARQLERGASILHAAHDQGYSDQFHLARSLHRILGQTPSQIKQRKN